MEWPHAAMLIHYIEESTLSHPQSIIKLHLGQWVRFGWKSLPQQTGTQKKHLDSKWVMPSTHLVSQLFIYYTFEKLVMLYFLPKTCFYYLKPGFNQPADTEMNELKATHKLSVAKNFILKMLK